MSLVLLLCIGCDRTEQYQEKMKEYALQYYQEYMVKNSSIVSFEVTIAMMKKVGYDIGILEKCKDSSSVTFHLKENSDEVDSYQFNLSCK